MSGADCIVVGGGLIGMLIARELRAGGMSVVLLERGAAGREASWAGGGILSPLYPWRYPDPVTALARWSQDHYPSLACELADETGVDPEWTPSGLLILDGEEREAACDWAARHGAVVEAVDRDGALACEPALGDLGTGGLWMPLVAQVRNPRLMRALRQSVVDRGVVLREHTEVTGFRVHGGRVTGVRADQGVLGADCVVVAGGAWSAALFEGLGAVPDIQPVRGQMILFRAGPGVLGRIVLHQDRYVIPRRDGHVLAGSTLEYTGFDKATTHQALDALRQAAVRLIPALARVPVVRHWAGLRPGSPGGIPCIGEHPAAGGLYINTGHFRNGVVLGPASARLAADLVLGRTPVVDPEPYAFSAKRPA